MKKFAVITLILFGTINLTTSASSFSTHVGYNHRSAKPIQNNNSAPVGAPLDGGLLLILGSAGLAYYTARKQRARCEE